MNLKITRNKTVNGYVNICLSGDMNIYTVSKLQDFLLKELESAKGLKLDLDSVAEADTSAFQLLLFIRREAEAAGKEFHVAGMAVKLKLLFTFYRETI